jgi:hypothetical protein
MVVTAVLRLACSTRDLAILHGFLLDPAFDPETKASVSFCSMSAAVWSALIGAQFPCRSEHETRGGVAQW